MYRRTYATDSTLARFRSWRNLSGAPRTLTQDPWEHPLAHEERTDVPCWVTALLECKRAATFGAFALPITSSTAPLEEGHKAPLCVTRAVAEP